ncbi:MAG: HesA/MoeB/ThiF family protein [Deltaproteobacteria bacterium]|nr:HesA/MoeB/ThiF family protein [Deltaproteobacteria bacterium]
MLSEEEMDRYDRQVLIEEIGISGQEKLKKGKAFVCGAGGLGSPIAIYLAAAGVGTITIADHDRVALSNLNRQILHGEADIGQEKVASAAEKLGRMNSSITIYSLTDTINKENAADLVAGHDVIIDALDNFRTRYILNKAALDLNIPLIHGAVNGFEGRVLTVIPGQSTCLRCLSRGPVKDAAKFPVIGVAPGVIGAIQATEALKLLMGIGEPLTDRLLVYDGLRLKWDEFRVKRNPECPHCR